MRVYISGPLRSSGSIWDNVKRACAIADFLLAAGHAPYVPHLNAHWAALHHHDESVWLKLDLEWLGYCECLVRLPGDSKGADAEDAEAVRLGIPVVKSEPLKTLAMRLRSVENTIGQPMPKSVPKKKLNSREPKTWRRIQDAEIADQEAG